MALDLVTLDEIKGWLEIPLADTSRDVRLTQIGCAVQASIKNFCECEFTPTPLTNELHDGARTDTLIPENCPVISIEELRTSVDADGTGGSVIDAAQYALVDDLIVLRGNRMFSKGRIIIGLDYTHGYTTVPDEVALAMFLGVEAWLRRYDKKLLGTQPVNSRSKDRESHSFGRGGASAGESTWDSKTGLPTEVMAMLSVYRALEIPGGNTATRNR